MGKSIPPGLPWQVETADGVVHGSPGPTLTVSVATFPGALHVTATSSLGGAHDVDFGVPGGQFNSLDNTEAFDYAKAGTYTVTMSNGSASGSATVTVPPAAEEEPEG